MAKGRTAAKRRESNQLRKQIEELEAQNARLTREIATKTTKETQARDAAVPPKKANSSLNRTAGQAQPKSKSVPDNTESGQDDGDQGSKPGSAVTDPNESESEDPLPKPKKPKKSNKLYNEDGLKHGQIRSQKGIIYNLKTGKIARPKGEPGRSSKPGSKHTGFALRESMGIPSALKKGEEYTSNRDAALASLYLAQRRFIKNGAAALLDTSAPLSQQSAASVGVLEARFFQKYPRFQEFYEKGWPFRAILQTVLTNLMKSSNDSDDEEQEEVDPREPEYRCSNTPKENTTTTKRKQRVDQEDESEVEEDPTPKKKVKQVQKTAPTVPKSPIQAKQRLEQERSVSKPRPKPKMKVVYARPPSKSPSRRSVSASPRAGPSRMQTRSHTAAKTIAKSPARTKFNSKHQTSEIDAAHLNGTTITLDEDQDKESELSEYDN